MWKMYKILSWQIPLRICRNVRWSDEIYEYCPMHLPTTKFNPVVKLLNDEKILLTPLSQKINVFEFNFNELSQNDLQNAENNFYEILHQVFQSNNDSDLFKDKFLEIYQKSTHKGIIVSNGSNFECVCVFLYIF